MSILEQVRLITQLIEGDNSPIPAVDIAIYVDSGSQGAEVIRAIRHLLGEPSRQVSWVLVYPAYRISIGIVTKDNLGMGYYVGEGNKDLVVSNTIPASVPIMWEQAGLIMADAYTILIREGCDHVQATYELLRRKNYDGITTT